MKAKLFFRRSLFFNLDDDSQAFRRAVKATDLCSTLYNLDQWLRREIKYASSDGLSKHHEIKLWARIDALQEARDILTELLDKNNINFDEIYS